MNSMPGDVWYHKPVKKMDPENFATLHIDKPLVEQKMSLQIPAGTTLKETLSAITFKAGFSFIVLVNGRVSESNYCVSAGDEIHCLPQITGG